MEPDKSTHYTELQDKLIEKKKIKQEEKKQPIKTENSEKLFDPTLVKETKINEDFYALTWTALRKDVWNNKHVRGKKISLTQTDYFWIRINFTFFALIVLMTVILLLHQVLTSNLYTNANFAIVLLRMTLVAFAQKKLAPEFYQGLAELRYSMKHPDEFSHPTFAQFVGFCQLATSIITFTCIVLYILMANAALKLIMNFAGLAVISELDDWLGEQILSGIPLEDEEMHPNEDYELNNINGKMSVKSKLALLEDDLTLIDNQNIPYTNNCFIQCFVSCMNCIPWFLLPLITLPLQELLVAIHGK